ncbi:MAG: S-methyl-5-thioribose-1-phosphate isomerase [Candidatus Omnitrophota bacterium]
MAIYTIRWINNSIKIIDQRKLPGELKYLSCRDLQTLWNAIKTLAVRGAPAIGVAAAFGVLLAAEKFRGNKRKLFDQKILQACQYLGSSRPTAVNLFNALDRMKKVVRENPFHSVREIRQLLKKEALMIFEEDRRVCRQMGQQGAKLIKNNSQILTACNAGALATVDYGTALGVMYSAKAQGKKFKVYSCETRPLLQGARLTTWELLRQGIDATLICDNMAATLMQQGKIDAVITGADRIARNGDAANKIGTYSLAVLARHHRIPFYIAAPLSTFDARIQTGKDIPIEQRNPDEVTHFAGQRIAPKKTKVYNPAFDVTDHTLITAIVTEYGILKPPFLKKIQAVLKRYEKRT